MKFDSQAKVAFIVALVALVGSGLGFRVAVGYWNYYLTKEPVEMREHFATIPRALENWQAVGSDTQFDSAMIETLGTDLYLDRTYSHEDYGNAMVHLAYYTGMIDMIPHVPDRCMVAGGFEQVGFTRNLELDIDRSLWAVDLEHVNKKSGEPYPVVVFPHRITGRPITVRMPLGEFALRTSEFRHPDAGDSRIFAGFFFIANGHISPNPRDVRMLAFDKTDRYAYYCKVQITIQGDRHFDEAQFIEASSSLISDLMPDIMRCLPDWSEVEARSKEVSRSDA